MVFLYFVLIGVPFGLYLLSRHFNSFWSRKGVAFIPGAPFVGNLTKLLTAKTSVAELFGDFYFDPKTKDAPVVGINIFHKPALVIRDPELIKRILVKDFNSFSNRHVKADPTEDHMGYYNLFLARNPFWKELRAKLVPVFTGLKMRRMFYLMNDIGEKFNKHLSNLKLDEETRSTSVEIKELFGCFATDIIASCAFGAQANSIENPNVDFRRHGRAVFDFNFRRAIEFTSFYFLPEILPYFHFKFFEKKTSDFMREKMNQAFAEREKSGERRHDLIDALLGLQQMDKGAVKAEGEPRYEGDVLIGQAAIIFTAGYETSACTVSFSLFEIAWKPDIQKRLREEIRTHLKKSRGKVTYDNVFEMKYLDLVVTETMRLYPILAYLDRECSAENGYSLRPYSNFVVPKGMPVMIPVFGIQRDPKYYPNPEEFNPDRFAGPNVIEENQFRYMPFGVGSHSCIGARFGLYTVKLGLINLLRNHYVKPTGRTPKKLIFEEKALLQCKGGIHLELVRDPMA